jgi:hypothetical protein
MKFFESALLPPGGGNEKAKASTIILQLADLLFERSLLLKYSWTGKTIGAEMKLAFNQNTNIIKLFHTIVNMFVPNTSLADVSEMVRNKVVKFAKQRANTTHGRVSPGRVKNKKVAFVDDDDVEENEPLVKRMKGPLRRISDNGSNYSSENENQEGSSGDE